MEEENKQIELPEGETKVENEKIRGSGSLLAAARQQQKKTIEEIADVIPFMKGLTWDRLGKNGLQWPVAKDGTDTQILHKTDFKRGILLAAISPRFIKLL